MKVFNTLTNKKEEFVPIKQGEVSIYVLSLIHILSAYRGFFGSKPFSKTNQFLISQGIQPIDWRIQ